MFLKLIEHVGMGTEVMEAEDKMKDAAKTLKALAERLKAADYPLEADMILNLHTGVEREIGLLQLFTER